MKFPPEVAPRSDSVATVSAMTPRTQSSTPIMSSPPPNRAPMMIATPAMPATSPNSACGRSFSPRNSQPDSATSSGMVEAMIAASDASTVCMATKFRPR